MLIVIAKSAITLYISCYKLEEKKNFFKTCSNERFLFLTGALEGFTVCNHCPKCKIYSDRQLLYWCFVFWFQ